MIYVADNGLLVPGPNPGLEEEARQRTTGLRAWLPDKPSLVVSGTGRMHLELARALGVTVDRYSSMFGCGDRRIVTDGEYILLSDGTKIPAHQCTSVEDRTRPFLDFLSSAPAETVIITNRGSTRGILRLDSCSTGPSIFKFQWKNGAPTDV